MSQFYSKIITDHHQDESCLSKLSPYTAVDTKLENVKLKRSICDFVFESLLEFASLVGLSLFLSIFFLFALPAFLRSFVMRNIQGKKVEAKHNTRQGRERYLRSNILLFKLQRHKKLWQSQNQKVFSHYQTANFQRG